MEYGSVNYCGYSKLLSNSIFCFYVKTLFTFKKSFSSKKLPKGSKI